MNARMNALITQAWHVTKKDLRASRDFILVSVALTIVEILIRTVWPPLTMSFDPDLTEPVNQLRAVLPAASSLMAAAIVAQVVHADALAGEDGFWLTRPISRGTLFTSKLATILLAVVMPAALAQVVPMLAFGVPLLDVTRLVTDFLFYLAVGLMVVFAGAALTPNVRVLIAWVAALGIVWACVTIAASSVSTRPPTALGVLPVMITFIVMGVGGSTAAWHQYRTRRTGQSALIAAVTVIIVTGIPYVFDPPRVEARTRISSLTDEPAVPLGTGMRFKDGPSSVVMWPLGDSLGQCGVMVRVTQAPGIRPVNAPAWLSYRFVHRPTGKTVVFTYFALPNRTLELASGDEFPRSEIRERFQILYRYATVGPLLTSDDPLKAELKNVDCRDLDVVVRH